MSQNHGKNHGTNHGTNQKMDQTKIRLHILGLPHTITSNEFSHCAFTGKVLRFGPMMLSRGFEVYHYGIESAEIICTKHIDIMKVDEWIEYKKQSFKYLDSSLSDEEIEMRVLDKKRFIGDLGNTGTPLYYEFNRSKNIHRK